MSRNEASKQDEARSAGAEFETAPCWAGGSEAFRFCGGDMEGMMKAGPCRTFMRRHRLAMYTTLAVVGLGILVLQVGWLLGIIAFFRTI